MTDPADPRAPPSINDAFRPTNAAPLAVKSAPPSPGAPLRGWLRPLAPYGIVLALTLCVLALTLQIWCVDLLAPLSYSGDGMLHLMFTKSFVENDWYYRNPALAAPGTMEMYEFPAADPLPGLFIKGFGWFTHDPALINNLFYLLTYPLTSLLAYAVGRQMKISTGPAMLCALLYAFLPYHFYRGTSHLYLSAYFMVPVAVLVAWWIATGRLFGPGGAGGWRRPAIAAGLCLLVSLSGVYYPFFAGIFLATASWYAWLVRRDFRHFLLGGALTAVLVGGLLACLSPTLLYLRTHPHPPASQRQPGEAEAYGMKIAQLVLPLDGHRLKPLAALKKRYDDGAPLTNENTGSTLGACGAGGFLLLLGWLLFRPAARWRAPVRGGLLPADPPAPGSEPPPALREMLDVLSVFNGVAVLFGTVGGGASLFALLVSPQVRSVNRFSVGIAFLSLVAVAACLDALARRWRPTLAWRAGGWGALGLLFAVGVLDQTHPADRSYYAAVRREYRQDRKFYRLVEAALPAGAMVFQLPYLEFPEGGGVNAMSDYSHFRGYVLTRGLRWSYGAIKGGHADAWQSAVASLPIEQGVQRLTLSGFAGLTLERDGYADDGAAAEADLRRLLGPPAALRQRRLFFSLQNYRSGLRATMTPAQWDLARDRALHPLLPLFPTGFTGQESNPEHVWRWSARRSELQIENDSGRTRHVRLQMLANTGCPEPAHLTISGLPAAQTWTIDRAQRLLSAPLEVPPGESTIHFSCDGQPIDAPADPRVMVWMVSDLKVEEEDAPALK